VTSPADAPETVFYDGGCGLCHRSVRWILDRDPEGRAFRFAPLEGETFRARVEEARRVGLPDSLVVLTRDGRLLARSDATAHVLGRLGAAWPVVGALLAAVPRPLRDAAYDAVARRRHRLFERPGAACPVASPQLRARFDP
jgi:predicted DCC family thiol-disulfide oxidoreductase YuxK